MFKLLLFLTAISNVLPIAVIALFSGFSKFSFIFLLLAAGP
jgi:hypothetical protein